MAELADARDSKSRGDNPCRFESGYRHQNFQPRSVLLRGFLSAPRPPHWPMPGKMLGSRWLKKPCCYNPGACKY